jgi:hypothetical protein
MTLNGEKRFLGADELLADLKIKKLLRSCDPLLRRLIKHDLVHKYRVDNYRQNDIFFAGLRIFLDELTVDDVVSIVVEGQQNNQMIGLDAFQETLLALKPELLRDAMGRIYGDVT